MSDSEKLVVDRVCSEAANDGLVGNTSYTWVLDGASGVAVLEESFEAIGYDVTALAEAAIPICD